MGPGTRETVVRWLQARSRRDFARLAALTAADARWESPVAGTTVGRDAVVRNVKDGFEDTEQFASELLALECRGDRAVAVVHNTGRRQHEALDSLQTLFLRVDRRGDRRGEGRGRRRADGRGLLGRRPEHVSEGTSTRSRAKNAVPPTVGT